MSAASVPHQPAHRKLFGVLEWFYQQVGGALSLALHHKFTSHVQAHSCVRFVDPPVCSIEPQISAITMSETDFNAL